MKVVVCGAGQVGSAIARYLSREENDVTVIDTNPQLVRQISDTLDVQGVVGYASHPEILERAGTADADLLVAVTFADEVNMIACSIAHSLFEVPTKIARVRAQTYLDPRWADLMHRTHMGIDAIISPEIEVAKAVARRLQTPGAFDTIPLADGRVTLIGVHCHPDCPVINTPLRQLTELFPDLHISVVAIIRNDVKIVPSGDDLMMAGDDVYFVADSRHLDRALAAFGHEEPEARRLIIVGGGNIGQFLARIIEEGNLAGEVRMIEIDRTRAERASQVLEKTIVLQGDALDPEILAEANVKATETVIAVSNDDEVNILASLLAKRYGAQRSVTLINKMTYAPLLGSLGIDAVVSPRSITVSTILQHVRRGRIRSVHTLADGFAEIIEADAMETSRLVGVPLREARFPAGIIVGAILRNDEVITPRGETVIEVGDRVIMFAVADAVKHVEKMFSVRLEFF